MRNLLLILLTLLVLITAAIYLLIPSRLSITSTAVVKTTDLGVERFIENEANWVKWWNHNNSASGITVSANGFIKNGDNYHLTGQFYKSVDIQIIHKESSLNSKLIILPLAYDSTGIQWACEILSGNDPITKLVNYTDAKKIKRNMDEVLSSLTVFLSNVENVYGINIEKNHLKDTLYVTAKTDLTHYPSTEELYTLIKKIHKYTVNNNVAQSGSPIYNVTQMDNNRYQLMAGIPVNKELKETDGFAMKNMVKGFFMISEVVGGNSTINKASESLQQYFLDFKKTSMAMNFTMLVTDRLMQPDSSKWVTKLYRPVY